MLSIYKKRRISQALVIKVMIETSIEVREVRDLVDCDTKRYFMSQSLATDTKFFDDQFVAERIQVIDDRSIFSYDKHQIVITICDNENVDRIVKQKFYTTNMLKYNLILRYSSLNQCDSNIY